ncbi:Uu.00g107580.m01.CDS01 [Anthostomella pinea]|uniref:Uu.00g107580.m01.CDS01 n=1 Tax=Anthostomella pinea TaxID=933095 RepID=A0AAI8VEV1_9PEZI|nr:Uu.00g107580.m01.CDS01 [Anthostomella pinea]
MASKNTLQDLIGSYNNFDEPEPAWNRPATIIGLSSVLLVLSTACVIFRLYVRLFVIRSPGWDDLFVSLYLITTISGGVSLCLAPQWGLGQHFLVLKLDDMVSYLKVFYVTNASYNTSAALIKISLLFQYMRIFDRGMMRMVCIFLLVMVGLWGTAYSFMAWFPCFPAQGYWDWTVRSRCYAFGSLDTDTFFATYASQTALNMVFDILVLSVPIPMYFRKDTCHRTKLGLLGLFFMGGIVNGLSIWRLATIINHRATTKPTFDPTWYSPVSILLGMMEVTGASICASVPVFWPVLTARIEEILVTREIQITRAHRFSGDGDDRVELQHSRTGSEASLAPLGKQVHYNDDFVRDQVDPLRQKPSYAVESEITAGGPGKQRSRTAVQAKS